jgi:hypothetical protein
LLPIYALFLLVRTYGLLLLLAITLLVANSPSKSTKGITTLLVLVATSHMFVSLLIANNTGYGDPHEIKHKTFVLPYFIFAFCCSMLLHSWLFKSRQSKLFARAILGCAMIAGVIVSATTATNLQCASECRHSSARISVPQGTLEVASYIKDRTEKGETVQLCENDPLNQLATLSERPVYISKIMINTPPLSAEEQRRFAKLSELLAQETFEKAQILAREIKITWLAMNAACNANWNDRSPELVSNGYRLYKFDGFAVR